MCGLQLAALAQSGILLEMHIVKITPVILTRSLNESYTRYMLEYKTPLFPTKIPYLY